MLLYFVLFLATFVLAYLLYLRTKELHDLRKYSANIENELLQKQIKAEESVQYGKIINGSLINQNIVDPITGLPSTQVFEDRAQQTIHLSKRFNKSFGILLLDIFEFSNINAKLGSERTNTLLNEVAKKLNGCIRQIDTVSRYNDDIFFFLLPQLAQPETAAFVAQRILARMKDPFYIGDEQILLKVEMGIAVFPNDGENFNTLLQHAEKALEQVKAKQLTYQFYNEEIQKISVRAAEIAKVLNSPDLLKKLIAYCVPQVNVSNNRIVGVKMLAYIDDPNLGLLTHEEYQKIAEKENKSTLIIEWLLMQAIEQFPLWLKQGLQPERITIEVSPREIQQQDFLPTLATLIKSTDFDPKLLAFEVSADNFADNAATLQEAFLNLKQVGVQLSVGVFALGHLAIQKITQLPLHYLKVDQRVVKNLSLYSGNETVLTALKELSRTMGLMMVVEGVDNEKQKESLQGMGFEVMQGKFFGEPKVIQFFMR